LASHQDDIDHSKGNDEPCLQSNRGPNNELAKDARYLKDALHAKEQALAKSTAALDAAINEKHNSIPRTFLRWRAEVLSRSGSGMLHAKNGEIDSDEEEYLEEDVNGSSKPNTKRSGGR
jgi:hypothetical protein